MGECGKEEEIAHLECLKYPGDPEGDEAALQESDDFAFSCPEQRPLRLVTFETFDHPVIITSSSHHHILTWRASVCQFVEVARSPKPPRPGLTGGTGHQS